MNTLYLCTKLECTECLEILKQVSGNFLCVGLPLGGLLVKLLRQTENEVLSCMHLY